MESVCLGLNPDRLRGDRPRFLLPSDLAEVVGELEKWATDTECGVRECQEHGLRRRWKPSEVAHRAADAVREANGIAIVRVRDNTIEDS